MATSTNNVLKVIEVRVITHTPNPPTARVALIFNNGTSSAFNREFPDAATAEIFSEGLRAGLDWKSSLENSV
jgi:hypothetical protein